MKKEAASKSLAGEIPSRVIDQSAETIAELCEATGRGQSWIQKYAASQVGSGHWERVCKRIGRNIVTAYRRA